MELRTERLVLRPFVAEDFGWLHPIASDPVVTRWTEWGPNEEADTRRFLDEALSGGNLCAVVLGGAGIGSAGIAVEGGVPSIASFGYTLAVAYWGKGFATEIARALVRHAREELGVDRVEATCHPENVASARVLEKAGLSPAGTRDGRLLYALR